MTNGGKQISLILILGCTLPLYFLNNAYLFHVVTLAIIWGIASFGLNIITGYLQILDMGFICYLGFGAYLDAIASTEFNIPFYFSIPLAVVCSVILGAFLSLPLLRLRGHAASIVTLGYGLIFYQVITNIDSIGGPNGIKAGSSLPEEFEKLLSNNTNLFAHFNEWFVIMLLITVSIIYLRFIYEKPILRLWTACGDDEELLAYFKLSPTFARLSAFCIAGGIGGLAGALMSRTLGYITPGNFTLNESILILGAVIIGGRGNLISGFLSAISLIVLGEYLRITNLWQYVFFGTTLLITAVFLPNGILPFKPPKYKWKKKCVNSLMTNKPIITDSEITLTVDKIAKSFGSLVALHDFSLQIPENSIIGLSGPNGSGKSVFIEIISGKYFVDHGTIVFNQNHRYTEKTKVLEKSRWGISRTFQTSRLFEVLPSFLQGTPL